MFNKIASLEAGKSLGCGGRVWRRQGKGGKRMESFFLCAVKLDDILVLFLRPGRDGGAERGEEAGEGLEGPWEEEEEAEARKTRNHNPVTVY